jgi:hypothetical protein
MASVSAITFNTGSTIVGTTQVNDFAIGTSPQDYSENIGGLIWWGSPDTDLGYIIAHGNPNANQPNSQSVPGVRFGFWRSELKTEASFIERVEYITIVDNDPQTFATGDEARDWLTANGYFSTYNFNPTPSPSPTLSTTPTPSITPTPSSTPTSSELLVYLDSGNLSSYPTSGNTWFDLEGSSNNATLFNTPTFSSSYQGILQFDDTSSEYATIPNIGDLSQWTVECWFRLTSPLTGKVTSIISNEFNLVNKLNFSIGTNLQPTNANLCVGFYDGDWRTTSGFVPQVGVWYQVVGTYDGSTIRQYVNGVFSGGTLNYVGTSQSGGELRIMRRWDGTVLQSNLVDGDLSIVKIYNSALSAGEVLSNYNSTYTRFLEVTPTPSITPTITPTSTSTPTPTVTDTPTSTPTPTSIPVTGYGYNLVVLPYNPPTSGNTIFPTFANPSLNSGTTNPNTFDINAIYWNSIDNTSVDRTNYYSGMTGVSVTAYFTQNGHTAIYSGSPTAFTFDGPTGQQSFNYNPNDRPEQLVLIQSASTNFVTGQTVYISYVVNTTVTPTPTPTNTQSSTPTNTVTPTNTPTPSSTPSLVTSGLIIQLDAYENSSYPGTGTTVYDITGGYNHTLIGATYTVLNGIKCFDCTTGNNRVNYNATGPTLPTSGYTYITWARLELDNIASFRTLLYTNSPKYTPITIPNNSDILGYWDSAFRSSGYDLSGETSVWVQYTVVGTNSSQTFYINGSQVGSTIAFGAGGTTHWGWGNNDVVPQAWGYVANMYFYDRILSLSEITQQYNFLAPRFVEGL